MLNAAVDKRTRCDDRANDVVYESYLRQYVAITVAIASNLVIAVTS